MITGPVRLVFGRISGQKAGPRRGGRKELVLASAFSGEGEIGD